MQRVLGADGGPVVAVTDFVKLVVDHEWLRAEGSARNVESKEEVLRRLRSVRGVRGVVDRIQVS